MAERKHNSLDKLYLLADFLREQEITIVKTVNAPNKLCIQISQKTVLDANAQLIDFIFDEEVTPSDIENENFVIL